MEERKITTYDNNDPDLMIKLLNESRRFNRKVPRLDADLHGAGARIKVFSSWRGAQGRFKAD